MSFVYGKYRIAFMHLPEKNHHPWTMVTACSIWDTELPRDEGPVAVGMAKCSRKDKFDRFEGRAIAFGRALQEMFPNNAAQKAERHTWWVEFARHNKRDMGELSLLAKMSETV